MLEVLLGLILLVLIYIAYRLRELVGHAYWISDGVDKYFNRGKYQHREN